MAWQDRQTEWDNLQSTQQKLGEICMVWAAIDHRLNELLADMLDVAPIEASAIVTGLLLPKKAQMLSRLVAVGSPSPEWSESLTSIAKQLAGSFGESRNRYIHDAWRFELDEIRRVDARAVSDQQIGLTHNKEHPASIAELENWCAQGYKIILSLDSLKPELLPWIMRRRGETA